MNKPASYFTRLRRRKAAPKLHKHRDLLRDVDRSRSITRLERNEAGPTREPELANEF